MGLQRFLAPSRDGLPRLTGFGQRLVHCGGALVHILDGDADDRGLVRIDTVLGLAGQTGPELLPARAFQRPAELRSPDEHDYAPRLVPCRLCSIGCPPLTDNDFVDYGCGKGRSHVLAALRSFRRVIGLEISPVLCAAAWPNLARAHGIPRCAAASVFCTDATAWSVPPDDDVFYFGNPFSGLGTGLHHYSVSVPTTL